MAGEVSARMLAFHRGAKAFKDGKPRPHQPPDEDFNPCTLPACEWLGWMMERGKVLTRQWRVRDFIEHGHPL